MTDFRHDTAQCNFVRTFGAFLALAFLIGPAGCQRESHQRRYELKGKVVAVDRVLREVTIAHDEVPGYMSAMTMPFVLKEEWAYGVLRPGDRVNAMLVVDGSHSWLEDVVIAQEAPTDGAVGADGARTEGAAQARPGDAVPDFLLVNQSGSPIHMKQYGGRALALTFIYTRCPLPDYCPLMSGNFAEIEGMLKKEPELYQKTHLLSVTLDPEYDTPRVLARYGAMYTPGGEQTSFDHWELATGRPDTIKQLAEFFGLRYWQEKDQVVHSLRTAVVDPGGKVFKLYEGNDWRPQDVLNDLSALARN